MVERTETIYVLYGSQTGNSEQAAQELCQRMAVKLSPQAIQRITHNTQDVIHVKPTHMQLDDFLEIGHAPWTRLMVIITSSYGVGQAPLGCYRFRELCDAWLEQSEDKNVKVLDGLHYALCGLGDSKYTTFFRNPTTIDNALQRVGATRVGELGKADASGVGDNIQSKVIDRWIDGIWPHLAKVVAQEPLPSGRLEQMQKETVALCRKINPEFMPTETKGPNVLLVAVLVALFAIIGYFVKIQVLL